jgi:hypothetical protein
MNNLEELEPDDMSKDKLTSISTPTNSENDTHDTSSSFEQTKIKVK